MGVWKVIQELRAEYAKPGPDQERLMLLHLRLFSCLDEHDAEDDLRPALAGSLRDAKRARFMKQMRAEKAAK